MCPISFGETLLIKSIAPLINPIALLIVSSIIERTLLIPDLTESPIALPNLVPKEEKVDLILSHNQLKKLVKLLKADFILFHASLNLSPNQEPTSEKVSFMLSHFSLNQSTIG